jgi:formamidopyrimidine-DNA glycosylase
MVFRRTNLPCLRCGEIIRQLRQKTFNDEAAASVTAPAAETIAPEERTRIVYYCAKCQKVDENQV